MSEISQRNSEGEQREVGRSKEKEERKSKREMEGMSFGLENKCPIASLDQWCLLCAFIYAALGSE